MVSIPPADIMYHTHCVDFSLGQSTRVKFASLDRPLQGPPVTSEAGSDLDLTGEGYPSD